MAKKEEAPQIEAKAETQNISDYHHTLEQDLLEEICNLMIDVESEIEGLGHAVFANSKAERKLPDLVEARNTLARTSHQLRRGSYCVLYGTHYTKYAYGEISEDEFDRILGC